jgi:hypothetical protein
MTLAPTAECTICGHGNLTGGVPPTTCVECGGVYGSAGRGRCAQCNRAIIGLAPECEAWLMTQIEEPTTVTVTVATTPGGNDPPGQHTDTIAPEGQNDRP